MISHDDGPILKEIAAYLPYATWRQDVRNLVQIPGRLSGMRDLWPLVRENEDAARETAALFYEALIRPHSAEELEDAKTESAEALAKQIEPITDLPRKIRGVLQTIEDHSCHIDRPRGVEDLVLALRDSLAIVEDAIEEANM